MEQLIGLYTYADMSLHRIASSHREVLEGMPVKEVAPSVDLFQFQASEPIAPVLKALSMIWITKMDCFAYSQDL